LTGIPSDADRTGLVIPRAGRNFAGPGLKNSLVHIPRRTVIVIMTRDKRGPQRSGGIQPGLPSSLLVRRIAQRKMARGPDHGRAAG
jgi:hypothetical protein